MKRSSRIGLIILIIAFCLLFSKERVNAVATTLSWSGINEVNLNTTFTEDVIISGIDENLTKIEGKILSADSSCVELLSITKVDENLHVEGERFTYTTANGTNESFTILRATFKSITNICETTIEIGEPSISFIDGSNIQLEKMQKKIVVKEANQPKSSDATLKKITPDKGILSPTFSSGVTDYTIEVPEDTEMINFELETNDDQAKIHSGYVCSLTSNETICKIVVCAEDESIKNYQIIVRKFDVQDKDDSNDSNPDGGNKNEGNDNNFIPNENNDATLKALDISGFSLNPIFKSNVTNYSISVPHTINGLEVKAIASDAKAVVKIEGNSGWKDGINPITIIVTAIDGKQKIYTISANRKTLDESIDDLEAPDLNDNFLKSLVLSNGNLKPNFDKEISNYTLTVSKEVSSLKVEAIPNNEKATVKVEGNQYLKIGNNTIVITVTAVDGSNRTYTISIYRSSQEGNNLLEGLSVDGYTITPTFDPEQIEYELNVENVEEIKIRATAQNKNAEIEIIGNKNLKEGRTLVQIKVTDENGFTKTYFLNVNKTSKKIFLGLTPGQWLMILGSIALVGILLFSTFLLLKKKKKQETKQTQDVDLKPVFNFGAKYINEEEGAIEEINRYAEVTSPQNNNRVTKDDLFDAIQEARKTKDSSKLKMLYEQELLNRKRAELKAREEN